MHAPRLRAQGLSHAGKRGRVTSDDDAPGKTHPPPGPQDTAAEMQRPPQRRGQPRPKRIAASTASCPSRNMRGAATLRRRPPRCRPAQRPAAQAICEKYGLERPIQPTRISRHDPCVLERVHRFAVSPERIRQWRGSIVSVDFSGTGILWPFYVDTVSYRRKCSRSVEQSPAASATASFRPPFPRANSCEA